MPGKTCDINIPYTTAVDDKAEYVITFSLILKKATSWSKQGYEMAQQQFKLSAENVAGTSVADPTFVQKDHGKLPAIQEKGKLKVKDNTITGKDFSITFAEDGASPTGLIAILSSFSLTLVLTSTVSAASPTTT